MPRKEPASLDRFMDYLTFPWLDSVHEMWVILSWRPDDLSSMAARSHADDCRMEVYTFLRWCIEHRKELQAQQKRSSTCEKKP